MSSLGGTASLPGPRGGTRPRGFVLHIGSALAAISVVAAAAAAQVQVTLSPSTAVVPVGGCFQFTVGISPPQPTPTILTATLSDPSEVYRAENGYVDANASTGPLWMCANDLAASPVQLTATLPVELGGASASSSVTVLFPVPVVVRHDPQSAWAGTPGLILNIWGAPSPFFTPHTQVLWNGSPRPWEGEHVCPGSCPNVMHVALTAADLAEGGTARVDVVNPPPGGGTVSFPFEVLGAGATAVPTLSPALLIVLGVLLAAAGVVAVRRL
jgi:hypothetical protein